MTVVLWLLVVQGIMGAFDNLWHHELTEALHSRVSAWKELALHAARAAIYGIIFLAVGWSQWHGVLAVLLALLVAVEVVITLWDFLEEDLTRKLPPLERLLHTLLALNYGAVLACLVPVLWHWYQHDTALQPAYHGWLSWIMTIYAIGILAWSIRDAIASLVLYRQRIPEWRRKPIRKPQSASGRTLLITGATGFLGKALCRRALERGDRVLVLVRDPARAAYLFGDRAEVFQDLRLVPADAPIDAIINLAGAPVLGRPWTKTRREMLMASRLGVTSQVVDLIRRMERLPKVLVSASATGYYGDQGDHPLNEDSLPQSGRFMSDLCLHWEAKARVAETMGVRVCLMRMGIVLGPHEGALAPLALSIRLGLGAVLGSGAQWMPWIHVEDVAAAFDRALSDEGMSGPFNLVAPHQVRQGALIRAIVDQLHRPVFLRIPRRALNRIMGEMSDILLSSARVSPDRLEACGFGFRYRQLSSALKACLPKRTSVRMRHGAAAALTSWLRPR